MCISFYVYLMCISFVFQCVFPVFHPLQCEACHRESFTGFRYKCQRCYNYNLCQDCFWRGRTSGNHSNDHDVKEYSFYVNFVVWKSQNYCSSKQKLVMIQCCIHASQLSAQCINPNILLQPAKTKL